MDANIQTKTKFITSSYRNAPPLENKFGSLIKILRATLTDGFNAQRIVSSSYDSSSKQITIKLNPSHGFTPNSVVLVEELVNKEFRILFSDATSITVYSESNIQMDGLTIKFAPLGYTLAYDDIEASGTACFQTQDKTYFLKVIDALPPNGYPETGGKYARVVAGRQIDLGGNFIDGKKFPLHPDFPDAENTGNKVVGDRGIHGFAKWFYALRRDGESTSNIEPPDDTYFPTSWEIIGDGNTFYLFIKPLFHETINRSIVGFGRIADDPLETCILIASDDFVPSRDTYGRRRGTLVRSEFSLRDTRVGNFISHDTNGKEGTTRFSTYTYYFDNNRVNSIQNPDLNQAYSSIENDGQFYSDIFVMDEGLSIRGYLRGIRQVYGSNNFRNFYTFESARKVIITVRLAVEQAGYAVPYLFSLEDWE